MNEIMLDEKTNSRVLLLADALAKEAPVYIEGEPKTIILIKWTPDGIIFCAAGPYGAEVAYPIDTEMSFKPPVETGGPRAAGYNEAKDEFEIMLSRLRKIESAARNLVDCVLPIPYGGHAVKPEALQRLITAITAEGWH